MAMCNIGDRVVRNPIHGPCYGKNMSKAPISNFEKAIAKKDSRESMKKKKNGQTPLGIKQQADTAQDSNILKGMGRQIQV